MLQIYIRMFDGDYIYIYIRKYVFMYTFLDKWLSTFLLCFFLSILSLRIIFNILRLNVYLGR